jgi:hypothetical protein
VKIPLLYLVYCSGQAEDFPHCWCFADSRIEVSKSFLYCLVMLHFVQLLFCDDHHRTRCTLQVHEKVHLLSFASSCQVRSCWSWSQTLD